MSLDEDLQKSALKEKERLFNVSVAPLEKFVSWYFKVVKDKFPESTATNVVFMPVHMGIDVYAGDMDKPELIVSRLFAVTTNYLTVPLVLSLNDYLRKKFKAISVDGKVLDDKRLKNVDRGYIASVAAFMKSASYVVAKNYDLWSITKGVGSWSLLAGVFGHKLRKGVDLAKYLIVGKEFAYTPAWAKSLSIVKKKSLTYSLLSLSIAACSVFYFLAPDKKEDESLLLNKEKKIESVFNSYKEGVNF
ncbi:hypothetical protein K9L97_04290 [Candidatus Woesearchaeota archaeon]|nr:hypothetical protein [Candidatus Woesearchaeota archaeon]